MSDPAGDVYAVVTWQGARSCLRPRESIGFGRAPANRILIGADPEDDRVSRRAGSIECTRDGVVLHNLSEKHPFDVQTFPGRGFTVPPLEVRGSRPHTRLAVRVTGTGRTYVIGLDLARLTAAAGAHGRARHDLTGRTTTGVTRIDLPAEDRHLLAAVCLRPMTRTGPAAVPTHATVAADLTAHGHGPVAPLTVRNRVAALRTTLVEQFGVDELWGPSPGETVLDRLARWARRSGNVLAADLEALDLRAEDA
ncbi:hypothetical protein WHI96_09110 [Pseudonocardia tropica]|uniref:FHA domain-containing protein n=1 Tax=Pseudonocardia tropica TaxID=681289 RepID=A0ABV1JTU6_9PSEU